MYLFPDETKQSDSLMLILLILFCKRSFLDIDGEFLVRLSTNSSRPREAVGTVEGHDGINT